MSCVPHYLVCDRKHVSSMSSIHVQECTSFWFDLHHGHDHHYIAVLLLINTEFTTYSIYYLISTNALQQDGWAWAMDRRELHPQCLVRNGRASQCQDDQRQILWVSHSYRYRILNQEIYLTVFPSFQKRWLLFHRLHFPSCCCEGLVLEWIHDSKHHSTIQAQLGIRWWSCRSSVRIPVHIPHFLCFAFSWMNCWLFIVMTVDQNFLSLLETSARR